MRVQPAEVEDLIWDYDTTINLNPFIRWANLITDRLSELDTDSELSSSELKEIEKHLAAYAYTAKVPLLRKEKTGRAEGEYELVSHKDMALALDSTGNLKKILDGGNVTAGVVWLGKPPSTQIDYLDRD